MSKPVVVLVALLVVMVLFIGVWLPAYARCRRFGSGRLACAATVFPWGSAEVYR